MAIDDEHRDLSDRSTVGLAVAESRDVYTEYSDDPLFLQNSDNPGMLLVTSLLTGNDYLTWSRSIKITLEAKAKLRFIENCICPGEVSPEYDQWVRVDCMAASWILNSIDKHIVEAFLYTLTAKKLWDDFEERFSEI